MLTDGQLEQIRLFATEVAEREGCLLYDLDFGSGSNRNLRVFIDKIGAEGVSIEDCANVSRGLNLRLDVEDIIPGGAYDLEISSPGLDRRLTQLWHFEKAIGRTVSLKARDGDNPEIRPYEGQLIAVSGSTLEFTNSRGPAKFEFSNVEKARLRIGDVLQKKSAPGKKKKGR